MASDYESRFTEELFKLYNEAKCYNLFPKSEYYKILEDVKTAAENKESRNQHGYYLLRKYEVLQCGPVEKLIKKREHRDEDPMYFVTIEETFDVLKSAYIATGHGGRDRMIKETKRKYAKTTF